MFRFLRKKTITFEQQLERLSEIGIRLHADVKAEWLLDTNSREQFEKDPYLSLLIVMGEEAEIDGEWRWVSDDVWYMDAECIEDTGDYVRILEQLMRLTDIKLHNVRDQIDFENRKASISFEYNQTEYFWELEFNDDWLDMNIFYHFKQLIGENKEKYFATCTMGQFALVCFLNMEQFNQLNRLMTAKWEWA
ncbi:hypothetical protein SAMN04487969_108132 [Paenibacillus algorifonticola]|uniref:Uncharacterized protein n=1 Tax=Paenibacillus algorifonticola TaxID=684063 RepID=A0A1I2E2T2_9BACL|nr:hypothetical protein [Paenibacillus algorifonticola]SFE86861.1 hypothetical protein SAMN04487969_108132 [Paenibacillus algorifonticola]